MSFKENQLLYSQSRKRKKPNQLPLICNIFSYPLNTCFTTYYFSRVNHLSYVKEEGT